MDDGLLAVGRSGLIASILSISGPLSVLMGWGKRNREGEKKKKKGHLSELRPPVDKKCLQISASAFPPRSAPPMDTMFEEGIFGSSAAGLRCCIEWMEQSEMRWERVTE